ncbi:unnamed protein product [Auanema sp. JU1783]|nr:unnamed protein product [Auanema sp. JU1783]
MKSFIFLLLCLLQYANCDYHINVTIQETSAVITGWLHPYGKSWRGIPYALSPIGTRRFMYAQEKIPTGYISALSYDSICKQGAQGSEDCLYLNVFSSVKSSSTDRLPVYVFIHGGGFVEGSGEVGPGIYPTLVDKGLILVTFNYRLGPFGFFSTRDTIAPGNFAISDCIEALKWVQRYISNFGGDPKRVTVGGHSSGAEAVSFLSLTNAAKGLYSKLIIQSGSAFGAAVMSYSEKTRNTSAQLAVAADCATKDQWDSGSDFGPIVNCLRDLSAADIVKYDSNLPSHRMKWSGVADKKYFPTRLETLALQRPSVPVLIGDVHDEWLAMEEGAIENNLNSSSNSQDGLRQTLKYAYEMTYWDNQNAVYVAAANKYINNQQYAADDHVSWMAQHIKLYSEMVFIGPVLRDAKYFAYTRSNVFLYSFDYLAPQALPAITQPQLRGVPHAWELQYVMNTNCEGWLCTSDDDTLRTITSDIWANFIISGNPSPAGSSLPFSFPRIGSANSYVSLKPNPTTNLRFHDDSMFWACTAPTIDGYAPPFC